MSYDADPPAALRLFYVDDSGAAATGHVVYAWVEVAPHTWRHGLRTWLDFRKALYLSHKVPPSQELHASPFVNGRGTPSLDPAVNRSKRRRRDAIESALRAIRDDPHTGVGSVYRKTDARGKSYARERVDLYERMIDHLESRLADASELGMIFMDGDGHDPAYRRAHRGLKLADRRIIEDPIFQGSHVSQWVQMADLVAWTTYQGLLRHPGKRFAWPWYNDYLVASDVNGRPLPL